MPSPRPSSGTSNLVASAPHAFDDESVRTGHLRIALPTRDVIGPAKGTLMERHRMTADLAATGELTVDRKRSG